MLLNVILEKKQSVSVFKQRRRFLAPGAATVNANQTPTSEGRNRVVKSAHKYAKTEPETNFNGTNQTWKCICVDFK